MDGPNGRIAYRQIIVLSTELGRTSLSNPVDGFYFCCDTCILYRYQDSNWVQLTTPPTQSVIFIQDSKFPDIGSENVLYIDGLQMYRYVDGVYKSMVTASSSQRWIEV